MKRRFHKLKTWLASGLLLTGAIASAQQYPFPQNVQYTYGLSPANKNSDDAKAAYTAWKATYVKTSCKGGTTLRVTFDDPGNSYIPVKANGSVSEGIGYGLLLSAYFGDKTTFDGLWAYYKAYQDANGLMNWIIDDGNCSVKQANSATDADVDAAWALYVAHYQWGNGVNSQYLTDCKTLIAAIKAHEVESGSNILKPGDAFGGSGSGNNNIVNLSYFAPAYFTEFGIITGDAAFWNGVVSANYALLNKALAANGASNTGLVPDWCQGTDGKAPAAGASTYHAKGANFYYDAVRTPFRIGLDYLWHGTAAPLAYCKTVNSWLGSIGAPANLHTEYTTSGTAVDSYHNNTFVGCFSAATMATDQLSGQSLANSFYADNKNTTPASSGAYFNASWKALSLLLQTGNFYIPPPDLCSAPDFTSPTYDLCHTGSQVLDCRVTDAGTSYSWKLNGTVIANATSRTYTATQPGIYEVTTSIPQAGGPNCVRRGSVVVNPAKPTANFTYIVNSITDVQFTDHSSTGIASYAWTFGALSNTPASMNTIPNPSASYTGPGVKVVTETVTDICGNTATYTASVTAGTSGAGAGGWYATNFRTNTSVVGQGVYIAPSLEATAPAGSITVDSVNNSGARNCKNVGVHFKTNTTQYSSVGITFKKKAVPSRHDDNYAINIATYPYVQFRIYVDQVLDSLRVDLLDTNYNATSWKAVYLKGPRNANGTYQQIPANTWFVSTLDFTGRFTSYGSASKPKGVKVDSTNIWQINFYPYAQYTTATGRKNFNMTVDWVMVGNVQYPKPDLSTLPTAVSFCQSAGSTTINVDTCLADGDSYSWNTGSTKPSITVSSNGTYTVTATNFGGTSTASVVVSQQLYSKAAYSYSLVNPDTMIAVDASQGSNLTYKWYKSNVTTGPSLGSGNVPVPFTGMKTGDTVCLKIQSKLSCFANAADLSVCHTITFLVTGLEDFNSTTTNVYPTLVNDELNILLGGKLSGDFDVRISNMNGIEVYIGKISTGLTSLNLSDLKSGVYMLNVKQDDKSMVRKFIKQ